MRHKQDGCTEILSGMKLEYYLFHMIMVWCVFEVNGQDELGYWSLGEILELCLIWVAYLVYKQKKFEKFAHVINT